jgi:ribonuclease-3
MTFDVPPLFEKLGYSFVKPELLVQALTHKSYHNENPSQSIGHNEIFEFLGDSVLSLVLSRFLMERFPDDDEGPLSKKRASLVNESTLFELALFLGMDQTIRLGKGEKNSGGALRPRLLASALEATFGAIFLDSNYENAERVIRGLFLERIERTDWSGDYQLDFKTRLQETIQATHGQTPTYNLLREIGPDHDKKFEVEVVFDGKLLSSGMGTSKKQAEQDAARKALEVLKCTKADF